MKAASLIQLDKKGLHLSTDIYNECVHCVSIHTETMSKVTHVCECSGVIPTNNPVVHDEYVQGFCYCLSSLCNFVGPFTPCVRMSWKSMN